MIGNTLKSRIAAIPDELRMPSKALQAAGSWTCLCQLANIRSVVLAVAVTLAPAPSLADFSAPITLSDIKYSNEPQVTVNGNGHGVVVWEGGEPYRIQARSITAAGVLAPIRNVSPLDPSPESARAPQVAIDADGDALFVWTRFGELQARARSKTGTFGLVETLSNGNGVLAPQVAIDAQGDAVVVWVYKRHPNPSVEARAVSKSGALGPVLTLSTPGLFAPGQILQARVAVDADGDALVVWRFGPRYGPRRIDAVTGR